MKKLISFALACASAAALSAPASATVYDVNLGGPGAFLFGTVTTDDTIGSLTSANLVDWTLFIGTGADQYLSLTPGDSQFFAGGQSLVASPANLTFDFSNPDASYFGFSLIAAPDAAICVVSGPASCYGETNGVYVGVGENYVFVPQTGVQFIGTAAAGAVPETATWGMMIAGFGMIGAAARRRKTVTKVSFA